MLPGVLCWSETWSLKLRMQHRLQLWRQRSQENTRMCSYEAWSDQWKSRKISGAANRPRLEHHRSDIAGWRSGKFLGSSSRGAWFESRPQRLFWRSFSVVLLESSETMSLHFLDEAMTTSFYRSFASPNLWVNSPFDVRYCQLRKWAHTHNKETCDVCRTPSIAKLGALIGWACS
jgi:hypothetical protein